MEAYRHDWETLVNRLPTYTDPIADFQEEARRTLLAEQESIRTGRDPLLGSAPTDSDAEDTEEEEDHWGLHHPPELPEDLAFPQSPLGHLYPPAQPLADSPEPIPPREIQVRPSPPEDTPSFVSLTQRAALHFNIPMEQTQPSASYLLSKLAPPLRTVSALPMEPLLWEAGIEIMKSPASCPAINPRMDEKYRVPQSAPLCLWNQPFATSIISASANVSGVSQVPDHLLSPSSKGAKKWDAMGKRVLATSALQARTANYGAVLARYDRDVWDSMEDLSRHLPDDKKVAAASVMAEGRQISNSLLRLALDSSDSAFRQMNNGVWMRRQGWLADCTFAQEVRSRVLDLPFDGTNVFGQEADALLLQERTRKEAGKAVAPTTKGRSATSTSHQPRSQGGFGTRPFPQPQFFQSPSPHGRSSPSYLAPQRGSYAQRQGGGKRRGTTRGGPPPP